MKKDFKFDKRASAYDEGVEGKFSRKFYAALLSQVKLEKDNTVLDIGCGTGYLLRLLADCCKINGYGIDVEQNMINIAKQRCPDMTIQLSACEKTPFANDTFDTLTACMEYHHFSDKSGFAREASRIIKTGGFLYIADPYFPYPVRKILNGVLRIIKVTGKFFTPQEMGFDFNKFGFELVDTFVDGIVQIVVLQKSPIA